MTEEDIHVSLEVDRQIEEAARYVGLETSMAALDSARELARAYGLDNLLAAMREAVDVHTWRYVKGILKKGGAGANPDQKPTTSAQDEDEVRWL